MEDIEWDMIKLIDKEHMKVYLSPLPSHYYPEQLEKRMRLLPQPLQNIINGYKDWQSRWLRAAGKNLLQKICIDFGFEELSSLTTLQYSDKNKPTISDKFDFSISHSSDKVVCAVIKCGHIGVDIENKGDYAAEDFNDIFNDEEIVVIEKEEQEFYKLWTKKEALAKATGMGVFFNFKKYPVIENKISIQNKFYVFEELPIDESSIGFICVSNFK